MDKQRFKKQKDFILEIDKEKSIFRQTHLTGLVRKENDAEHAWHMAIMAWLLQEYANEELDMAKVMLMCLIHDIVEIDAGDTYAYDEEGKKTQEQREAAAAKRIFGLLPEDQGRQLHELFYEFENRSSPEARFARVMDNLQPLLLNISNEGHDWREHDARGEKVRERNSKNALGSTELSEYISRAIDEQIQKGNLKE